MALEANTLKAVLGYGAPTEGPSMEPWGGGKRRPGTITGAGTGHWVQGPRSGIFSTWARRRNEPFIRLAF